MDQRSQRDKDTQSYYIRIANKLQPDGTHYSEVFKRWEFVPNSRQNVQFHKAKCQICDNTFLKNLFKIRPVEIYRHLIPPNSPPFFLVGSICVQNFCHRDENGNTIHPLKRENFVRRIREKRFKEHFYDRLAVRVNENNIEELFRHFPRLNRILHEINKKREARGFYCFQTISDAIVFAVMLGYTLKQMTKFFFKMPIKRAIRLSTFTEMGEYEALLYAKCYRHYQNRDYIVNEEESIQELEVQEGEVGVGEAKDGH